MNASQKLILCSLLVVLHVAWLSNSFAATNSINPIADAFVTQGATGSLSVSNFGGGGALLVASPGLPNGEFQTVMKFDLSGARAAFNAQFGAGLWAVKSVTLQLTAQPHSNPIYNPVAAGQFSISLMKNNSWVEGTGMASTPTSDGISFSTLISTCINTNADQFLGTFDYDGGSTNTVDATLSLTSGLIDGITAGTNLSLRLYAADAGISFQFNSRSGSPAATRPLLTITAVPQPRITSVAFSVGNLVIAGTNGLAGAAYNVLTSADLRLPLENWAPLATNTFDTSGNFTLTNPVNATTGQQFYLLRLP